MTDVKHLNIVDSVSAWVLHALHDRAAITEDVSWSVGLQVLPDPSSGWLPWIAVYLSIPLKRGDSAVYTTAMLRAHGISEELISDLVEENYRSLVKQREEHLASSVADVDHAEESVDSG